MRVSIINKCQLKCSFCGGNETHMENFQPDGMNELIEYEQLLKIIKIYIDLWQIRSIYWWRTIAVSENRCTCE